jgi:hypothetical protein
MIDDLTEVVRVLDRDIAEEMKTRPPDYDYSRENPGIAP